MIMSKEEKEDLHQYHDAVSLFLVTLMICTIAAIVNLSWGSWGTFGISIAVICGFSALSGISGYRVAISKVRGTSPGLWFFIIFGLLYFATAGFVHLLWWSDHTVRMYQIYLGVFMYVQITLGGEVTRKIEDKIRNR